MMPVMKRFDRFLVRRTSGVFSSHISLNNQPTADPSTTIPSSAIHANTHNFWRERLTYNVGRIQQSYLPTWDRLAHVAIMLARPIDQQSEPYQIFRHIIDGWRRSFILQLTGIRSTFLPALTAGGVKLPDPEKVRKQGNSPHSGNGIP